MNMCIIFRRAEKRKAGDANNDKTNEESDTGNDKDVTEAKVESNVKQDPPKTNLSLRKRRLPESNGPNSNNTDEKGLPICLRRKQTKKAKKV